MPTPPVLSPVPLPPLTTHHTIPIHRQPQAVPVGFDRQGRPSPSEVGPGVSGRPLLVGCLHEPPSRQDGGIRRWRVRRLPRRGSHPLQQRPLHQGCAVRWSPKDGRVNTELLMCRILGVGWNLHAGPGGRGRNQETHPDADPCSDLLLSFVRARCHASLFGVNRRREKKMQTAGRFASNIYWHAKWACLSSNLSKR